MTAAPAVLLAVATELAKLAKSSLPEMRNGETIQREWFENGIYYRETIFDGKVFQNQYDFRKRKSLHVAVVKK